MRELKYRSSKVTYGKLANPSICGKWACYDKALRELKIMGYGATKKEAYEDWIGKLKVKLKEVKDKEFIEWCKGMEEYRKNTSLWS